MTPLNDMGVAFRHLHFRVNDVDASKKAWVDVFGATPGKSGTAELLKIPGVDIFISRAAMPPTGGTQGSSVHHIGISVKDYAATLSAHVVACAGCRELAETVSAIVAVRDEMQATASVPESGRMWWRAQYHIQGLIWRLALFD